MASKVSRFPWTPPQYQRDNDRPTTVNAAKSQTEEPQRGNVEMGESAAAAPNAQEVPPQAPAVIRMPELPFGLLLKKAIRGDRNAVTVEEALEELESMARARVDAAVEPELDPNAKINTWLDQSGEHLLRKSGLETAEEEAAVTFQSLSVVEEEEEVVEERGERSKRPEENRDEEMSEC